MHRSRRWKITTFLTLYGLFTCALLRPAYATIYHVDCTAAATSSMGADEKTQALHSLDQVNSFVLLSTDTLLFRRGTACKGSLKPRGNGFSISAYGEGKLPRIEASPEDEAALFLNNQEQITVSSLELIGGTTYGVHITGDKGVMHSITLQNLTVRDVRGSLKKKASGLVVIGPASADATFTDVTLDGVRAFDTTQWSGIFIAGGSQANPATRVMVRNSIVHDVQGDGIVLFNARDSSVRHSLAWHTGMQHQQSIGTPNAIWTWQCTRCDVSESEAFLADSPGVDGGAFDIDWGNTQNTVQHNYGHDTQGYCVSIFGANGPTSQSLVDGNVCINNGQSPRLAQREGAILLMTWSGGSIQGLTISNNVIYWRPAGNTPAIQAGSHLDAKDIQMSDNRIFTGAEPVIDPAIPYTKAPGHATSVDSASLPAASAKHWQRSTGEDQGTKWRLIATYPKGLPSRDDTTLAALLVDLTSAAVQYHSSTMQVELLTSPEAALLARDWDLPENGAVLRSISAPGAFSVEFTSPSGPVVRSWNQVPSLADLGPELRHSVGEPDYSRLPFVSIRATD